MIKYKGVTPKLLHRALIHDQLDELIHAKFTHVQNEYYRKFKESGMKVQDMNLYPDDEPADKMKIYDDRHCENCENDEFSGWAEHSCDICGVGLCGRCGNVCGGCRR